MKLKWVKSSFQDEGFELKLPAIGTYHVVKRRFNDTIELVFEPWEFEEESCNIDTVGKTINTFDGGKAFIEEFVRKEIQTLLDAVEWGKKPAKTIMLCVDPDLHFNFGKYGGKLAIQDDALCITAFCSQEEQEEALLEGRGLS